MFYQIDVMVVLEGVGWWCTMAITGDKKDAARWHHGTGVDVITMIPEPVSVWQM